MKAPSSLIIPCSKLPEAFVTSPYLSYKERGMLVFLLSIGHVGENGVPLYRASLKTAESKYAINKLWVRLIDRGFIEKTITNDTSNGHFRTKYTVRLDESLLKSYTPKKRERTNKPDINKALDDILTRYQAGEINKAAAFVAIAELKK